MQSVVANRIRTVRTERGMSQTELALKCNVSKSLISKIEANKATMHLDLLIDIANALEITLFELLETSPGTKKKAAVVKAQERRNLVAGVPGKVGYRYYRLAGSERIDTFWLSIEKEAQKASRFVVHAGYEFFYIVEGKIKLTFHDEEYVLQEGDTASFNASDEHKITPYDCDLAQLILIFVHD